MWKNSCSALWVSTPATWRMAFSRNPCKPNCSQSFLMSLNIPINIKLTLHLYISTFLHFYISTFLHFYISTSLHLYVSMSLCLYVSGWRVTPPPPPLFFFCSAQLFVPCAGRECVQRNHLLAVCAMLCELCMRRLRSVPDAAWASAGSSKVGRCCVLYVSRPPPPLLVETLKLAPAKLAPALVLFNCTILRFLRSASFLRTSFRHVRLSCFLSFFSFFPPVPSFRPF
jgi:hypothetical protein